MKHNKSFIAIALFSFLLFANANAANVTDDPTVLPVELKFLGIVKNQPLLQLNFSGTKEENEFSICITDESGFIFYSANTKGERFSKQFLLDTDDLGGATLNFQITGRKSGKTVVYRVSRQAKEVSYQMDIVKL